jgi:hypothetical protein
MHARLCVAALFLVCTGAVGAAPAPPLAPDLESLYRLWPGQTKQVNALWPENPKQRQFGNGRSTVVIADLKGPGVITMIHFAMPEKMRLNRDTVLRIYWDGEKSPSVQAPLVDFFCDPNGVMERVDSALVNKKRGWNCYFPMPFAKSARVVLSTDNPRYPNGLWAMNPCYSYVMYRSVKALPSDAGYFHALWRQQTVLLGKEDYRVVEANGRGHFIGWNATVRGVGAPNAGYVVDENVKFYVDGEREPSIEWQGIEDSFGFSYGFPEQGNNFPYTGYQPYYNGAAAYRFTLNDRVSFRRSLRMTVGFGKNESPWFREVFSKPENPLQFSSVAYWYQKEPHVPFAPLPGNRERQPLLFSASAQKYRDAHETIVLRCGHRDGDEEYVERGWDFSLRHGYMYAGWPTPVNHCWADYNALAFDIICPRGVSGTLRMFIIDGDNFAGGRRQSIRVAGRLIGVYQDFQAGRWIEVPISPSDTAAGRIPVVMNNLKPHGNAVVSLVQFIRS